MSITISEALKLEKLKGFKIIAGKKGLNNKIIKVGILDHEIVGRIEGQFIRGEFALSSLLGAKDDVTLIFQAVKNLIEDGVSGLGVKNIYFKELPAEIIEYANEKGFPIFIFDNSVFFEDIITDVSLVIGNIKNYELIESQIDNILMNDISKMKVREIALKINPSFKENFIVAYCREKEYTNNGNIISILEKVNRNKTKSVNSVILKYRSGIFVIYSYEKLNKNIVVNKLFNLINSIGLTEDKYFIGISNYYSDLNELNRGINESVYAQKTSEIYQNNTIFYKDIGIYKILIPSADQIWIREFYKEIIPPLISYDEKYNTEILNTAIKYIDNEGKVKKTSNDLFQHENTIRYRINKMKEILGMSDLNGNFYEQLSIAIKIHKIFNKGL